jgi:betaine reductase
MDEAARALLTLVERFAPDVVIAGPAFNSGRYGLACARVCHDVGATLGRPAITAMHPENAAVESYRRDVVIVPTAPSALGMNDAGRPLAGLALKLGRGDALGPAAVEGCLPRGRRLNVRAATSASSRALDMLLARLRDAPFVSEVPLPRYDRVPPPPPVAEAARMRLALVTESGLVPPGNPDRLEWVRASKWLKYPIGARHLAAGDHEVAHGGYEAGFALEDPNRLLPVDAVRELERRGEIGAVLDDYYVTCGNHGILSQMATHAREIAADLRARRVDAVLLVAT